MNSRLLFVCGAMLLSVTLSGFANPSLPDAGVRAEMENRWLDAIAIYREALVSDPDERALWRRISDIEAHLGNTVAAADALQRAAEIAVDDADLYYLLAQARASANQPGAALDAASRAVELAPGNTVYLEGRARHANWNREYDIALESYRAIQRVEPGNNAVLLSIARTYNWAERYEEAAATYRQYMERVPGDNSILMDYMEVEAHLGNYDKAVVVGEQYRRHFGEGLEYWLHMSDLYALSGNDEAAAEAVEKATEFSPGDAELYMRVARDYAAVKNVDRALWAVKRALAIDPDNIDYYRDQAELAAWKADYDLALLSYEQILARAPDDSGAMLGLARVNYWMGNVDPAIEGYEAYLERHPGIQIVWAEYIQLQIEIGNYIDAQYMVSRYRERFGENYAHAKLQAQVWAWSGKPRTALSYTVPLIKNYPDDYDLRSTHTLALRHNHQYAQAVESLEELYRIDPDHGGIDATSRYVTTPFRPYVHVYGGYQKDTDDISSYRGGVEGGYSPASNLRVWLAGENHRLKAPRGEGYDTPDGDTEINYRKAQIGLRYDHSQYLSLSAAVGSGDVENGDDQTVYELGLYIRPQDSLQLHLWRQQDIYAVSPRAIALEIERRHNQLDLTWRPNSLYTFDMSTASADFSDDNKRWDFSVSPRRSVIRRQHFSLDLGIGAHWFAYDETLENGYYSPTDYSRYSANAYASYWFNENDGVSLSLSVGPYKDDTMKSSRTAGDITIEGTMGVYRDWMLEARAAFSQNPGTNTGAYRSRRFELALTRRF